MAIYNREPAVQLASRHGRQAFRRLFLDGTATVFLPWRAQAIADSALSSSLFREIPKARGRRTRRPADIPDSRPELATGRRDPIAPPVASRGWGARRRRGSGADADRRERAVTTNPLSASFGGGGGASPRIGAAPAPQLPRRRVVPSEDRGSALRLGIRALRHPGANPLTTSPTKLP